MKKAVAVAVVLAAVVIALTGYTFLGFGRDMYVFVACITIAAGAGIIADILLASGYTGCHRAPRKVVIPDSVPELPASAEARTETWPAIPAVAHEDTAPAETVVIQAAAPPMGHVDVSEATREFVEEFAGPDFIEWLDDDRGVMVRVAGERSVDLAHMGDRILRDEHGLHVWCTERGVSKDETAVFPWATGEFAAADAAIAAGEGEAAA